MSQQQEPVVESHDAAKPLVSVTVTVEESADRIVIDHDETTGQ